MNAKEFSDQFDVLYNNITSNQAPGLNEYEKSIFLTKAQDELVKNYFLPQSNPKGAGFDGNQKRQIDFSKLMRTKKINQSTIGHVVGETEPNYQKFDPRSIVFVIPNDVYFIINEQLIYYCEYLQTSIAARQVVPISFDEYTRLMSKPYKEPLKYQAWRLITGDSATIGEPGVDNIWQQNAGVAEIITRRVDAKMVYNYTVTAPLNSTDNTTDPEENEDPNENNGGNDSGGTTVIVGPSEELGGGDATEPVIDPSEPVVTEASETIKPSYFIRYVKRPIPIILADFSNTFGENLSIQGYDGSETASGQPYYNGRCCELDPILHEEILQRAVELAKVAWTNNGQDNVQLALEAGKRSE